MKLRDENRKIMVSLWMEKAHKFIGQAEMMFAQEQWDLAANRYYYACFHAVQALFVYNGLGSKTHGGMITQFGLYFVKPQTIKDSLGGFLTRMEQLRERGDYNCIYSVSKEDIEVMISPANELISDIEELLTCPPTVNLE